MEKEEKVIFEAGDVVRLKSGGPLMTIQSIGTDALSFITRMAYNLSDDDCDILNCVWFDGPVKHEGHFQAGALILDK
jgi:uncharacterized protein YodC (DUF2158 family)